MSKASLKANKQVTRGLIPVLAFLALWFVVGCAESNGTPAESEEGEGPNIQATGPVPQAIPDDLAEQVENSVRLALADDADGLAQITSNFAAEVATAPPELRPLDPPENLSVRPAELPAVDAMNIARFGTEQALRDDVALIIADSDDALPNYYAVEFEFNETTYYQVWLNQAGAYRLTHPPLHVDGQALAMIRSIFEGDLG